MEATESSLLLEIGTSFPDVVFLALVLAIVVACLWLAYRTMQRPRLPVIREAGEIPRANWPGVLRYTLTTPLMVTFWFLILLLLLAGSAVERTGEQVAVTAAAIVGCARLLAHLHEELAHEVAKTVPIVFLGFVLIGGGFAGIERFDEIMQQISDPLVDRFLLGLIGFDFVVTAAWFLTQRLDWRRRRSRLRRGLPDVGPLRRAWRRWRKIGYS